MGHVVVCGLHDDGLRFVEQLHLAGIVVIVVDDAADTRLIARLDKLEAPLLRAEIERTLTLRRAGIDGAMALVCAERDDLQTLATAPMARELCPDVRVVCQVHNPALGRALDQVLGGVGCGAQAGVYRDPLHQRQERGQPHHPVGRGPGP